MWELDLRDFGPEEQPFQAEHPAQALTVAFDLYWMFDVNFQKELNALDTIVDHLIMYRLRLTEITRITLKLLSEFGKSPLSKGHY